MGKKKKKKKKTKYEKQELISERGTRPTWRVARSIITFLWTLFRIKAVKGEFRAWGVIVRSLDSVIICLSVILGRSHLDEVVQIIIAVDEAFDPFRNFLKSPSGGVRVWIVRVFWGERAASCVFFYSFLVFPFLRFKSFKETGQDW